MNRFTVNRRHQRFHRNLPEISIKLAPGKLGVPSKKHRPQSAPEHWHDSPIQVKKDSEAFRIVDKTGQVKISDCGVELAELQRKAGKK